MFPGMQGPQPLPDQEAYPMAWKNLNRFLAITTVTVAVALTVRYCEQRTHAMLVANLVTMASEQTLAHLKAFGVVDMVSDAASSASAPLLAPLRFTMTCAVTRPVPGAVLSASVDFIADVACPQPPVELLPLCSVVPAGERTSADSAAASLPCNTAALVSSSPTASAAGVLLSPGVDYEVVVALRDVSALRGLPLKHLLQVSMMRVRLVAMTGAEANEPAAPPALVGEWNVLWHVRRDPQNAEELVRTLLSPLG